MTAFRLQKHAFYVVGRFVRVSVIVVENVNPIFFTANAYYVAAVLPCPAAVASHLLY